MRAKALTEAQKNNAAIHSRMIGNGRGRYDDSEHNESLGFWLRFVRCTYRANARARSTGDTKILFNNVLSVTLGNRVRRTLALASAAINAIIVYYVCHINNTSSLFCALIIALTYTNCKKAVQNYESRVIARRVGAS